MERKGHFFKILVGDFENCLRIPPAFVKYLQKGITQATLECSNGKIRRVKLQQKTRGLYFQDGWKDFLQDHTLREYDLLVFSYEGGGKFSLEMFDRSACQKEDRCTNRAPPQCDFHDQRKKQSVKQEFLELSSSSCEETSEGRHTPPNLHGLSRTKMGGFEGSPSNKRLTRQPGLAGYKSGAREKAESFSSKSPYFIVELKMTRFVGIPSVFSKQRISKQHFPRPSGNVTLQGPDDRLWVVKYIWRQQRLFLSAGLVAFTRDNGLVKGDFCAFESLDNRKIRVHIFRLAE